MFAKKDPSELDLAIKEIYREMQGFTADSEEYAAMVDQLEKLHKIKSCDSNLVSYDTVLIVAGNILGIVLILSFEKTNVIATKALQMVLRAK